ncbi:MAG TPA: ATP-binding protein [Marmoricola sp.]|nr:ATP-binding protein [Marmoricola sp.]
MATLLPALRPRPGEGVPVPAAGSAGDDLVVRVAGLSAGYGSTTTLRGVDLEIRRGEVIGIAGENGAGKSTLVRCIAGDLEPLGGEVGIAAGTRVDLAWQRSALCDNLDIAENLLLGRERHWRMLAPARAHGLARRLLGELQLDGELTPTTDLVGQLSEARRQLLAIARAAGSHPDLLLLDEPTASLGVADTARVDALVQRLHRTGTTVLLVSHDIEQLFRLADRIVVLRKGRVAGEVDPVSGHPDDVAALVSGHEMTSSAHYQLSRLHALTDRLASADPAASPLLILSALGTALGAEQLALHVADPGGTLRLLCALGLPTDLRTAWETLPTDAGGGPIGLAGERGEPVIDADVRLGDAWRDHRNRLWELRIASSWAVPFHGAAGPAGVITVFRDRIGSPTRSELDLATLYGGYAANALDRDRLVGELTSRNLVLETIREVLETLTAPMPIGDALDRALRTLLQGVQADAAAVFSEGEEGSRCLSLVTRGGARSDATELATLLDRHGRETGGSVTGFTVGADGWGRVVGLRGGQGIDWLVVVRNAGAVTAETGALVEDAAHSVRLALERDRAQQAAQETAALRRSRELQRGFLRRLSHELRTPLTAIGGYADTLLQPDVVWDADSRDRFLTRIGDEARRLGRLVDDLLDHSAIESGVLRLQRDWCDLALVVDAARACLLPGARDRIHVDVPRDLPPVWADHDRLEQVFVNLFDNAVRHNPAQTRVWVGLEPAGAGAVAVTVRDDGVGRAADLMAAGERPRRRTAGAGLGLSIARAIVEAHGGSISVSQADPGLVFHVTLPAEPDEDVDADPDSRAGEEQRHG